MKINIIKRSTVSLILAIAIMAAGIVAAVVNKGLNLGVDFTGGQLVTLQFEGDYNNDDIQGVLNDNNAGETTIMRSENNQAVVRMSERSDEELSELNEKIISSLSEKGYKNVSIKSVDRVGAVASKQLVVNALLAIGITIACMLIYITFRFEFYSGLAAVLALIHDVLIMLAFVAIFRVPINSGFIAAILTIIGYSINSTILVFDQVRENKKLYPSMKPYDLINKSVSDTFWRSVNTSLTTLITVSVLYIFGVPSIREFTLPIIVGLIAGAFSSIMLAGQWWYFLKYSFNKNKGKAVKSKKEEVEQNVQEDLQQETVEDIESGENNKKKAANKKAGNKKATPRKHTTKKK